MNISLREKIYLLIGGVIILPLFIYQFVITPINNLNSEVKTNIKQLIQDHNKIGLYDKEIQFLRSSLSTQDFEADSAIRKILKEMGLVDDAQINSIPGAAHEKRYKITLNEIRSDQLMVLIYNIENNTPVMKISKLNVSRSFRMKDKRIKVEIEIIS